MPERESPMPRPVEDIVEPRPETVSPATAPPPAMAPLTVLLTAL